jgi:hypothetical protein
MQSVSLKMHKLSLLHHLLLQIAFDGPGGFAIIESEKKGGAYEQERFIRGKNRLS